MNNSLAWQPDKIVALTSFDGDNQIIDAVGRVGLIDFEMMVYNLHSLDGLYFATSIAATRLMNIEVALQRLEMFIWSPQAKADMKIYTLKREEE